MDDILNQIEGGDASAVAGAFDGRCYVRRSSCYPVRRFLWEKKASYYRRVQELCQVRGFQEQVYG